MGIGYRYFHRVRENGVDEIAFAWQCVICACGEDRVSYGIS